MFTARGIAVALITFAAFTDILAYSIAVPVLPDVSARFGASPTVIGLLFASFGLTVLLTSVPSGALSDRLGRKTPLVGALIALALASTLFAYAPSLAWLFGARLVQGAADAVTWVVGFAVVADLYDANERGRVMGLVMAGTTSGFLVGPTLGGWLYEIGGARLPYLAVAALALVAAAGLAFLRLPATKPLDTDARFLDVIRAPAVVLCIVTVIVGGGTIAMIEPVLSLFLSSEIGLGPARVGLVFGAGAVVSTVMHPVFGRIADRVGSRSLMLAGLAGMGVWMPVESRIKSFETALLLNAIGIVPIAAMVTPSLAYMAEATSTAGSRSFGISYGLYNFGWALGILAGPSIGGYVYERLGFAALTFFWGGGVIVLTLLLAWARPISEPTPAV